MGSSGSKRVGNLETPTGGKRKAVRVWVLGGFRVSVGSRTISQDTWHLRKAADLVKLLALAPGHPMHREQAMDLLWPEANKRAASNTLRTTLHTARKVLDPAMGSRYLASEGESLVLCPEGELWVDVDAFEQAVAIARHAKDPATYKAALDLYGGDLLPEDRYEAWTEGRRSELRQLYLALLVELAGLHEERHEYESAIEVLRKATAKEPIFEEAHVALMRLHAILGHPERAFTQYERLHNTFSRELDTKPSTAARRLRDEIAASKFPPTHPVAAAHSEQPVDEGNHNLPAVSTTFVGREQEMVEVKRTLAMTQLLTLTGAGGSGKTRLALEVARNLVGTYQDGVWLVELAPLSEGALVPQAVAATLGVREQPGRPLLETLLNAVRDRQMLLILDNCEHLINATTHLAQSLLDSCPRMRVLATTREPLAMTGELVWLVPSLSAPGSQQSPTMEELEGYESVRLFADRASIRHPSFELTSGNAQAVAQVCAELEGIPLAIELAAARIGMLSVGQISERLGHSLKLLTRGERTADHRHQTLRATLDWSYDLLSETEQELFERLSAFAGGFTLEAAESVGARRGIEEEDVLELLSMLVDKSLVVAEESWEMGARYRLLEPVRQYAMEKLIRSGKAEEIRRRHAAFFLALAETAEPELRGGRQEEWLERLEAEHDNFITALLWMLEREGVELSLRFGATLGEFWYMRGHLSEGRRWLETVLAKGDTPSVARVRVLAKASWIAMEQADLERATALGEEGLKLARKLGDEEGTATALLNLGMAVMGPGELERSSALLEEGLPLFRGLGDKWGLTRSLLCLGFVAMFQGDEERAKALIEESLAVSREAGDVWSSGMALNQMALMALLREDYGRAEALCKETLELSRRSGMQHHIAFALHTAAALAGSRGQPLCSARLWGAAEALREAMGTVFTPLEFRTYGPYIVAASDQVEDAVWEAAWQEGRRMSMEEAVEYALSEEAIPAKLPIPEGPHSGLTSREGEVAALVARGLTNRQIATELSISEHTVANHLAKILRKLGLDSRSQLAVWVVERKTLP